MFSFVLRFAAYQSLGRCSIGRTSGMVRALLVEQRRPTEKSDALPVTKNPESPLDALRLPIQIHSQLFHRAVFRSTLRVDVI